MPTYEPDGWNAADSINVNNCYNYATNNRNKAEPGSGGNPTKKVKPATPGATKDLDPFKTTFHPVRNDQGKIVDLRQRLTITCKALKAACKADGVHEESHCTNNSNCWRIALYVWNYPPPHLPGADFHFAREDRPGHWSHKPRAGSKATNKQYNPATRKYDGPELTDPKTQNMGRYTFCFYLCVCPNTAVAYHAPPAEEEEGISTAMVTFDEYGDLSGMSAPSVLLEPGDVDDFLASVAPPPNAEAWIEGFGPGETLFRLDRVDPAGEGGTQAIFISEESLTIWDQDLRHVIDGVGSIALTVRELGWSVANPGGSDDVEGLASEVRALGAWVRPALIVVMVSVWIGIVLGLLLN